MYLNMSIQDASTLLAHQIYHHEDFIIKQILVNNQESDFIPFSQKQNELEINIRGSLRSSTPVDLELKIKDILGTPLAFYSCGHLKGVVRNVEPGDFNLSWKVSFPKMMTRGDYLLDIAFTNPFKTWLANLPNAVRLSVDGPQNIHGKFIEYRNGLGWLILE